MTTPDHRPYLTATDLRTPEDVLAFVHDFVVDPDVEWDLSEVRNFLQRKIDRERRQACRRAALIAWREFAGGARQGHDAWHSEANKAHACLWCEENLARALAFRAAARQP